MLIQKRLGSNFLHGINYYLSKVAIGDTKPLVSNNTHLNIGGVCDTWGFPIPKRHCDIYYINRYEVGYGV